MIKKHKTRKGFTLIEIMAVIVIIGLLAAVGAMNFLGQTDRAKVTTTKANLKMLHNAVAQFKMDTGRYPTQEEGLSVLITQPSDVKNTSKTRPTIEKKYPKKIIGFCFLNLSDSQPATIANKFALAVTSPSAIPTTVLSKPKIEVK